MIDIMCKILYLEHGFVSGTWGCHQVEGGHGPNHVGT